MEPSKEAFNKMPRIDQVRAVTMYGFALFENSGIGVLKHKLDPEWFPIIKKILSDGAWTKPSKEEIDSILPEILNDPPKHKRKK